MSPNRQLARPPGKPVDLQIGIASDASGERRLISVVDDG
jgi:hypothetical protein